MKTNQFPSLDGSGLRIGVIASRFNQELTDALLKDCLEALSVCNVASTNVRVLRVPGAFELPSAAELLASQERYDAIVCLGVVIKGDTKHDHYIADAVAHGLTNISITRRIPVLFGVLTTENLAQAEVRALGGKKKGWEVGMAAVEMGRLRFDLFPRKACLAEVAVGGSGLEDR